eukprot:13227181-Alexandrium_andersonii.AAC.1
MSASLVGSEMCIRDSSDRGDFTGCAEACAPSHRVHGFGWRRQDHGLANYPVSYTHLTLPTICSV